MGKKKSDNADEKGKQMGLVHEDSHETQYVRGLASIDTLLEFADEDLGKKNRLAHYDRHVPKALTVLEYLKQENTHLSTMVTTQKAEAEALVEHVEQLEAALHEAKLPIPERTFDYIGGAHRGISLLSEAQADLPLTAEPGEEDTVTPI